MPVEQSEIESGFRNQPCAMHTVKRGSPEVHVDLLAPAVEHSTITLRLAELDLIIKHAQWHLHETLELIDRLRAHYLHIEEKLSDAEREQVSLLTEASRLFDARDLPLSHTSARLAAGKPPFRSMRPSWTTKGIEGGFVVIQG